MTTLDFQGFGRRDPRVKTMIAWLVLRPLLRRDYRLRREGKRPDRMYWADALALTWGVESAFYDGPV